MVIGDYASWLIGGCDVECAAWVGRISNVGYQVCYLQMGWLPVVGCPVGCVGIVEGCREGWSVG